jgi:NTE family protein
MRALAACLLLLLLAACVTPGSSLPINPLPQAQAQPQPAIEGEGDMLMLALSGGGARSTAFSYGAMLGLQDLRGPDGRPLLDRLRLVTAVSGGSVLAAYYGQHGSAGLAGFRRDFLDKDWAARVHTSLASPLNWVGAMQGGMNSRPAVADWLDREVYRRGTMRELWDDDGPQIWLNATDLYNGAPFTFAPVYFEALCADLGSVRIADAVAASMAFPLVFQPVTAAQHAERCSPLPDWVASAPGDHDRPALVRRTALAFAAYRDPAREPYLHLVDGGVLDNLGLSTLRLVRETAGTPYGPLSARTAVRVRRLTVLVVNAEQGRVSRWQMTARGPNGADVAGALFGIAIESPNRSAYDAFRLLLARWQDDVRRWRCGLSPDEVTALGGDAARWNCADVTFTLDMLAFSDLDAATQRRLGHVPTNVSLPRRAVDDLIEAGRRGVRENPAIQALTR